MVLALVPALSRIARPTPAPFVGCSSVTPLHVDGWSIFNSIATGFAAIFTAIGVVGAVWYSIRQHQSSVAAAQEAQEVAERAQADQVAAWLMSATLAPTGPAAVRVHNGSTMPVHNLVIAIVGVQGAVPPGALRTVHLLVLPPGSFWVMLYGQDLDSSMHRRFAVETAFTDHAGQHWRRSATGELERLACSPPQEYDLRPPFGFDDLLINRAEASEADG